MIMTGENYSLPSWSAEATKSSQSSTSWKAIPMFWPNLTSEIVNKLIDQYRGDTKLFVYALTCDFGYRGSRDSIVDGETFRILWKQYN